MSFLNDNKPFPDSFKLLSSVIRVTYEGEEENKRARPMHVDNHYYLYIEIL